MVAGNYFLSSSRGEEEQKIVVANTPAPSPTATSSSPSLTPTPTKAPLDKKELSIQALNGSGTKGAASDLSAVLKEAGYTVAATGNAEEFDYQETVIQLKKSKQEYKDVLIADLEKEYPVSDTVETLAENARFDAIVVVGAK